MNKPQAVAERKNVLPDNAGPKKEKNIFIRFIGECDRPFLILVILLTAIGSVMMFSASYAFAETNFRDSLYFAKNQLKWIVKWSYNKNASIWLLIYIAFAWKSCYSSI